MGSVDSVTDAIPLGSYRVLRNLEPSGGAERYLARAPRTNGLVLVERLHAQLSKQSAFRNRLTQLAVLEQRIRHPHAVTLQSMEEVGGCLLLVYPWQEGRDTRSIYNQAFRLRRSIPLAVTLRLVADAALGWGHVARTAPRLCGTVTPQNILLTYDGLGVASSLARTAALNDLFFRSRFPGLRGSYTYASPEQIRGELPDPRTDVFGLGIVLYEMSTGTRLFKRNTEQATRAAAESGEVHPPRRLSERYPEELERIVLRALAPAPEDRFSDSEAFHQALSEWMKTVDLDPSRPALSQFMSSLFGPRQQPLPAAVSLNDDLQLPEPASASREEEAPSPVVGPTGVQHSGRSSSSAPPEHRVPTKAHGEAVSGTGVGPSGSPAQVSSGSEAPTVPARPRASADPVRAIPQKPEPAPPRVWIWAGVATVLFAATVWLWPRPEPTAEPEPVPGQGAQANAVEDENMDDRRADRESELPLPSVPLESGVVEFWVEPWALVFIDDRRVGLTPLPDQTLPVGRHRVRLENSDLEKVWEGELEVRAGLSQSVRVDLEAEGQPLLPPDRGP
ncbi:MAG: protein kinase [Myxococcota bacterium]